MMTDGDIPAELSKLQKAYELVGELSRDDLMTVYVARDRASGSEVTIKVLRAVDARGREALAHYASDARLLTALEHPNIVHVHAVKWLSEDIVAVVTERVRGPTLRQVLDVAGTLPVARATEVLRGLSRALAWAHSSQIMHRDVRPENVIFEDRTGRVVLTDLGLARRIEGGAGTNEPGVDAYRAPELADGRYPDRRSDVYSLGIVGWELLTGRRPWPDAMDPIVPGRRAPAPPPLAEVRPGLPPALVAALEGAVQLDRDRRITDVVTFMERLTQVAPPTPELEEELADETVSSLQPGKWLALPIPKLPPKPAADSALAGAQGATLEATEAAGSSESEISGELGVERTAVAKVTPAAVPPDAIPPALEHADSEHVDVERPGKRAEREPARGPAGVPPGSPARERLDEPLAEPAGDAATRGVDRDVPGLREPEGSRTAPRSMDREVVSGVEPRADADVSRNVERATSQPPAAPSSPSSSPESPRRRRKKGWGSAEVTSPLTEPSSTASVPGASTQKTPGAEQAPIDGGRLDVPAVGPGVAGAAVPAGLEQVRDLPIAPRAPSARRPITTSSPMLSDVELPPPEPVRFADLPSPVSTSAPIGSTRSRGAAFLEGMRGGLGNPLGSRSRARRRSGSLDVPPLQPVWDTPAEFPLPAMPDPRPMPADVSLGGAPRRRWTPRRIGIVAGALAVIAAAITLARMERTPDTTAGLIQPEVPAGYGGDVVLPPNTGTRSNPTAGRGAAPRGDAPPTGGARPAAGAAAPATPRDSLDTTQRARRSGAAATGAARTSATISVPSRARTTAAPSSRAGRDMPAASSAAVPTAQPPAVSRTATSQPGSQPAATRTTLPRTAPTQPAARQPGANQPTTRQPPARETAVVPTAATRPEPTTSTSGPCGSASAADQRTCLLALVNRQDAALNAVYGDVVGAMRARANSAPNDPDPPEVQRLRAAQRSWLARRDSECRRRGRGTEGPLWATSRARCFAEYTANRTRELSATLARLRRE